MAQRDAPVDSLGVIIPAYNAEGTVAPLIRRIEKYVDPENIFVINDGSTDATAAIAGDEGVHVVSLEKNSGKGAALAKGFAVVAGNPHIENVMTIDADLQHPPERIPDFVEMKEKTGADIVIGSRRRSGTTMPLHRRCSNIITSALVSARAGTSIPDSQCGFRLIARHVLLTVSTEAPGYEAETEFLIRAAKKGFRIESVPIETVYNGERSHMTNMTTTVRFVRTLFRDF